MQTTRARLLYLLLGFTIGSLLMGAPPLAAQDDCKVMEKAVADASAKLHSTHAHVYITSKVSGQTFTAEMIYAAESLYMKINGKWTLSGSIKDMEGVEQKNKKHDAKDTCHYVKDEPVNGEMAALYSAHSETPAGNIDLQAWISKANGLLLRQETISDGGKSVISARYQYGNVKPPL